MRRWQSIRRLGCGTKRPAVRLAQLVTAQSPPVRVCPLHCRIQPYLIKAAPLRSAAPGRARTGLRPWGPTRHGAPGIMRTIR